ncbi:MAG: formyl transferase [Pleurocapsa sp.]
MNKTVMLVGDVDTSRIVYNAIKDDFQVVEVIQEKSESIGKFLGRRIKKLGLLAVGGQVAFFVINKLLKSTAKNRIEEIKQSFDLDTTDYPEDILRQVESANSQEVIERLKEINPDVVVVNGTRIISKKVLRSVNIPFINTHTGITPRYRGVHGGYWALVQRDAEHCGVTVHLVDPGIDTGDILYQQTIQPQTNDNFNTYPYLQYAHAIPLIKKAIRDILENKIQIKKNPLDSQLWYHPTIFEYLKYRVLAGVK